MNDKVVRCISPVDGSVYGERPLMSYDETVAAVAAARTAQGEWAARPLSERVELLRRGCEKLCAMTEQVTPELAWMMGRPVRYGGEFGGVKERVSYLADIAGAALQPLVAEQSADFERQIKREPLGVVLVIAPWNYPYLTAINTVAPALIAGNAVFLKPSAQTFMAGERMVQAFVEAGIPAAVLGCVFLDHATTLSLIAGRMFDFVNFTGSVAGGRAVERAAAGTFIGTGLELGGKDPAYLLEDADVEAAAAALIDGAMFNSGQCCCGIERIYVAARHYHAFLEKARALVSEYVLGNPLDQATTLGPMASVRFAELARAQIAEAEASGATLLIDKKRFAADDGGAYLAPQILTGVDHGMRVMREESFAPLVGVMKVDGDEEAVALMNDSEYGLTASLWSGDPLRAAALGARLQTGTVFMNRADYLDPALCWSGCKNSGRGGALSIIGYHNLTRPKSYHFRKKST